jgi:hypothetical protein
MSERLRKRLGRQRRILVWIYGGGSLLLAAAGLAGALARLLGWL